MRLISFAVFRVGSARDGRCKELCASLGRARRPGALRGRGSDVRARLLVGERRELDCLDVHDVQLCCLIP